MTTAKVQPTLMDVKTNGSQASKNESTSGFLMSKGKDASFSAIMEMQSSSVKETAKGALKNSSVKDSKAFSSDSLAKDKTSYSAIENNSAVDQMSEKEGQIQKPDKTTSDLEETNDVVDAEAMEVLQMTMQNFLSALQETLGVTKEEFDQLLKDSGFTEMDLLNPANLQSLILNQFGADSLTEALLNEPLANALQDGLEKLNDLTTQMANIMGKEETDLTPEVMKQLLSKKLTEEMDNGLESNETLTESSAKELMLQEIAQKSEEQGGQTEEAHVDKELTVLVKKEESASKNQMGSGSFEGNDKKEDLLRQSDTKTDFIDYFAAKVNQPTIDNLSQSVEMTNVRTIITQIVDQIKVNISQTQTSMEVLLNPENLGHVGLVVAQKEGVMTAHFTVENQVTKETLESSIQILKQQFEEQGLKVADVEVTISNYSDGFTRNNDSNQASGNEESKQRGQAQNLKFVEETEEPIQAVQSRTNYYGTVEYTA